MYRSEGLSSRDVERWLTWDQVAEYYLKEVYRRREAAIGSSSHEGSELNEAIGAYQDDLKFEEQAKAKGKWTGQRARPRFGRP
jgi:hypothetical protein